MAYKEIDIDYTYKIFARYFHGTGTGHALNLFSKADREKATGVAEPIKKQIQTLIDEGIFGEDPASGDTLIPITGLLVVPAKIPSDGCPLVFLFHGMHRSLFDRRTGDRVPEVMSYRGHAYLQHELAKNGVMSLSINLNMVNAFDSDDDHTNRVQVFMLHFLLMQVLNGSADPSLTGAASPLMILQNGAPPVVLSKDWTPAEGIAAKSPLGLVQNLQKQLAGKINFSLLGTFGHSRGANAAANVVSFWSSPGTATRVQQVVQNLVKLAGNPAAKSIRAVVSLEPPDHTTTIKQDELFFLAIGSSHDEDVQNDAINLYESPVCPKGMVFIHGATHLRFNTVWRAEASGRKAIERNIRCQQPIRILSNASHDGFVNSFAGGVFLATLAHQPQKLLLFTREARAPEKIDVERAWKFSFPFHQPPGILELDSRITRFIDTSTGNATTLAKSKLNEHRIDLSSSSPFVQKVEVFKVEKKQGQEVEIKIPVSTSDKIENFTHFSFRYAKLFDIDNARKRDSEPLKNYEIRLLSTSNQIGSTITGNKIKSLIHRVYPTRKFSYESPAPDGCYSAPAAILQTTEVPFTQFFEKGPHTLADIKRIDTISVVLNAAAGKTGPDVFCLVDFICSHRNL